MVVADIRDVRIAAVDELVGREHIDTASVDEILRHVTVDIDPFARGVASKEALAGKVLTEGGIERSLLRGIQTTVVVNIELRTILSVYRMVEVQLQDVTVSILTHECPEAISAQTIGRLPQLVVLEANFYFMTKHIGRSLGLQVESIGLRQGIAATLDADIGEQTIDVSGGVTVIQTIELLDVFLHGEGAADVAELIAMEQLLVVVGENGVVLRTTRIGHNVVPVVLNHGSTGNTIIIYSLLLIGTLFLSNKLAYITVLENIVNRLAIVLVI